MTSKTCLICVKDKKNEMNRAQNDKETVLWILLQMSNIIINQKLVIISSTNSTKTKSFNMSKLQKFWSSQKIRCNKFNIFNNHKKCLWLKDSRISIKWSNMTTIIILISLRFAKCKTELMIFFNKSKKVFNNSTNLKSIKKNWEVKCNFTILWKISQNLTLIALVNIVH